MVDSHALVGSCAQIGKRVHLSAPRRSVASSARGARPVIVEDDAFVGGPAGVFRGCVFDAAPSFASGSS